MLLRRGGGDTPFSEKWGGSPPAPPSSMPLYHTAEIDLQKHYRRIENQGRTFRHTLTHNIWPGLNQFLHRAPFLTMSHRSSRDMPRNLLQAPSGWFPLLS